jgi:hypothetical protein
MTWDLKMTGHGTPNDEANIQARTYARALVDQLKAEGQIVSTATFSDNEGVHNLLEPAKEE